MNFNEWPMMLFTLFLQFSVGVVLIYDLFLLFPVYRRKEKLPRRFQVILLIALASAGMGILFSLLRLGYPVSAVKTLSNLNRPWLSREMLFTIIYFCLLLIVSILQFRFPQKVRSFKWLLDAAALVGLLLIYVMSQVYCLASIPAWNSIFTPADFFLAALLFGSAFTLLFQLTNGSLACQKALALLIMLLSVIQIILIPIHLTWLGSGTEPAHQQCVRLLLDQYYVAFYLRLGLEILTVAFGFWAFLSIRSETLKRGHLFTPSLLAFLTTLIGLTIDRFLFYIQDVPMP